MTSSKKEFVSIFKSIKHQKIPWHINTFNKVLVYLWNHAWLFLPLSPQVTSCYSSIYCPCQENFVNAPLPKPGPESKEQAFLLLSSGFKESCSLYSYFLWAKQMLIFKTIFFRVRFQFLPPSVFVCLFLLQEEFLLS